MAVELSPLRVNRWATSDGEIIVPAKGTNVTATVGSSTADFVVVDGYITISLTQAKEFFYDLGSYRLLIASDVAEQQFNIERVGSRYTDRDTIIAYGKENNDAFNEEDRYPLSKFSAAIQSAEEAIERGCRRRFCESKINTVLRPGRLCELPVTDCYAIDCEDKDVRLVSVCQCIGVTAEVQATITYGLSPDARISEAATRLAASYLRPRAAAENARGTAMDGVYVSYELATGDDGGWTGLPFVDSAIEEHRSRRTVIG